MLFGLVGARLPFVWFLLYEIQEPEPNLWLLYMNKEGSATWECLLAWKTRCASPPRTDIRVEEVPTVWMQWFMQCDP